VHKHGVYERFVILPDGTRKRLGVHRFRCAVCGRTISFLPDFCVPYKHFGADVVHTVLAAVLLAGLSRRAVAAWDSVYNRASFSRFCVGEWLQHFERNSHNLWHFGLGRLGVAAGAGPRSVAALFAHLTRFGSARVAHAEHSLRAVQCGLSQPFPPFGLFRAQLLPGCFT
jgi:hypothetical protein